jgi:hypothetical protein
VNPIHLNSLAAGPLVPRALVRVTRTKVHALAALGPRVPDAYLVDVAFGGTMLPPSAANLVTAQQDQG